MMVDFNKRLLNDQPNPKANIGFVAKVPYHFYVFKNVIKHLTNAEFIVSEKYSYDEPLKMRPERLNSLISLIEKEKICWRFFNFKTDNNPESQFFEKYDILIATTANDIIISPLTKNIKKIRLQYGQSKDLFEFGAWNRHFDLILSQGPYSTQHFKLYALCKEIGFPKFDDWFNNKFNDDFINDLRKKLNASKKTLLYMPTHGVLSSLKNYRSAFLDLKDHYNILVKFHHNTVWHSPEQILDFKNNGFLTFNDSTDILPLLKISDIVLTDSGGAAFDALLAEKPLVIIDVSIVKELTRQSKVIYPGTTFEESQTYDGSIEQVIKKEEYRIGPVINSSEKLRSAVIMAENDFTEFKNRRRKWRKKLFSFVDGRDGKRAASEIIKFQNMRLPPTPFWKLMITETLSPLEAKIGYLEKEVKFYRGLKNQKLLKKIKFIIKNLF